MSQLEQFYDQWYQHGYMVEWPKEKKSRVLHLISELNLPATGRLLDFGCGNGVFTAVLKQAVPGWEVYGSDLSKVAVENAAKRNPDCIFLFGDDPQLQTLQFDFIFSHHVLEHVDDTPAIAQLIAGMCAPDARMLHILPCGNAGSFEHKLCTLTKNGIRSSKGNTFFFEETMHLQRYTSDDLKLLFAPFGFREEAAWFANQYWGAIAWISGMNKQFIQSLTRQDTAKDGLSLFWLRVYYVIFICLYYLQRPYYLFHESRQPISKNINAVKKIILLASFQVKKVLDTLAEREWRHRNKKLNGSEMYLFFKKEPMHNKI